MAIPFSWKPRAEKSGIVGRGMSESACNLPVNSGRSVQTASHRKHPASSPASHHESSRTIPRSGRVLQRVEGPRIRPTRSRNETAGGEQLPNSQARCGRSTQFLPQASNRLIFFTDLHDCRCIFVTGLHDCLCILFV